MLRNLSQISKNSLHSLLCTFLWLLFPIPLWSFWRLGTGSAGNWSPLFTPTSKGTVKASLLCCRDDPDGDLRRPPSWERRGHPASTQDLLGASSAETARERLQIIQTVPNYVWRFCNADYCPPGIKLRTSNPTQKEFHFILKFNLQCFI